MAIAYVQRVGTANTGASGFTVPAGGVAQGHTLIVAGYGGKITGVTDSAGNTYTVLDSAANNGSDFLSVAVGYMATGLTSGQSITVSGSSINKVCEEFSGIASSSPLDVKTSKTQTTGTTSVTLPSTGTLAGSSDLYYMCASFGASSTLTDITTGLTALPDFAALRSRYQILSAATAVDYQGTYAVSQTYAGYLVTLKAAAASSPPSNTVAPAVTGTATVGSTLTTDNGTWSNSPTGYTYQWTRNGSNIASATASTYTLVDADDATTVLCVVTATNVSGSASANSNSNSITEPVATNSVAPVASGTAQVNATVSATTGTWTHMGGSVATYAYQWQDSADGATGWANIVGATSSNYTIASGEATKYLRCNVTATNTGGTSSATSSNVLGPVAGAATSGSASGGVNMPTSLLINNP